MSNPYEEKNKNPFRIGDALKVLGIEGFTFDGSPTNEIEFNNSFKKIMSTDSDGNAVLSSDPKDFGFTWAELKTEMNKL